MPSVAVRFDPYRSKAFGSITNAYTTLGTPTTHLMRIIHFVNSTDVALDFSFDGTTDNLYLPANSFALYDLETNAEAGADYFLQLQTQIYVKYNSGAPTQGSAYVIMSYAKGQ